MDKSSSSIITTITSGWYSCRSSSNSIQATVCIQYNLTRRLLALAVSTEESIESFLFYLVQYSITNLNAFMIILAFGNIMHSTVARSSDHSTDVQLIAELAGQFRSNPLLGLALTVCLFSMAGVPPLIEESKWLYTLLHIADTTSYLLWQF